MYRKINDPRGIVTAIIFLSISGISIIPSRNAKRNIVDKEIVT
jgi:hypothetical protein